LSIKYIEKVVFEKKMEKITFNQKYTKRITVPLRFRRSLFTESQTSQFEIQPLTQEELRIDPTLQKEKRTTTFLPIVSYLSNVPDANIDDSVTFSSLDDLTMSSFGRLTSDCDNFEGCIQVINELKKKNQQIRDLLSRIN
jgi:hypothetical protein